MTARGDGEGEMRTSNLQCPTLNNQKATHQTVGRYMALHSKINNHPSSILLPLRILSGLCGLYVPSSCMFRRLQITEASRGCFPRMGPQNSSEESTRGGLLHYTPACGIIIATPEERTWDGHPTCAGAGETDLRQGPSSPSQSKGPRLRFWSNLEPLNEP